ncbi:MAG: nucleotidyltransferase domain-containing protein [Nitriliruptoraceae bacterium]
MELPIDLEELRRVLRRHGVRFALVYGSQALGTAGAASDVDLGVWAATELDLWALAGDLPEVVDLVDLQRAPDGLTGRMALTGAVVLDDDPVRRVRWQADTRKRYLDEAPRRAAFRRDFVQAHG